MIKNKYTYVFMFAIVLVLIMAFSGDSTRSQNKEIKSDQKSLLDQKLEAKLARFKASILKKCKKEAIDKAELLVDSLVAEEFTRLTSDTIAFPPKPIRPSLPKRIILNDTTDIDPILNDG